MNAFWFSLYTIVLSLWVGGMALFTFIVTPVIFRSFGRDTAGGIVGKLFPGYFFYNLAASALALVLFFLLAGDQSAAVRRLSLVLLTTALLANAFITFKLHPEAVRIKQEVTSFERESPDSPARKKFSRLHAMSALLNLFLLADGVALLVVCSLFRK
jgi:uncharacterized membrane protein